MKSPLTSARTAASAAFACLLLIALTSVASLARGGDKDWKPVDPEQLKMTTPVVEKDADAEALFWEVYVDDSQPDELSLRHYIRIKVFNERGRDSQSKVDLPYLGGNQIKDIAARVIKPDGTIVELKKEDVFERTVVKLSGAKVKAKSFALPGVEPGAVIEYRYREVIPGGSANRLRLQFQRDIPVQSVTYYIKPYMGMRYRPFNIGEARFVKDKDGFSKLTMTNLPAFREEPRMPPEDNVRSWAFLYYTQEESLDPDKYWSELGKRFGEALKDDMKVNDEVKTTAASIVGDAKTPDEKLQRIYDFCRTKIKNINDAASGLTEDERSNFKANKTPADTLKRGVGTGSNIDYLFAALAKAAGFDARLALSGNRDDLFFDRALSNVAFLGSSFVAVRVGDGWQFFSPAEKYTTAGMLGWREEGQDALIADSKEPQWVKTPLSGPEKSVETRTGKFRLLEDGTLEGDVRIEYTGQLGYDRKKYNDDDSPAQREKTLEDMIKGRMSTAELSDIHVENVTDPAKPFTYSFHVRVPGYAQRTGKRLFLQPAFFQRNLAALFPTSERKNNVYFHFSWSEQDRVEIVLPEGFALDNPDSPAPINVGVSKYEPRTMITKDGRTLIYERKFFFGQSGSQNLLIFPTNAYGNLKAYFDAVQKEDNHTILLKQAAATAATGTTSN
ncbi:MAG TPA: DUF3857 and transglutaminase domain-containing protein [Pyrinomonadaceae bacterium]|nr:DUF3857 and transglutaminase domain-containing protein [Pyrinomonadaceae bacterium]